MTCTEENHKAVVINRMQLAKFPRVIKLTSLRVCNRATKSLIACHERKLS